MQELDIRYAFILLPIAYSILPFLLTGNFLLLGSISVSIFIIGAVLFALIFSLNIGGSGNILASGVSAKLGINQEGTYMLFVLVFGGLFYGITTFINLFLDDLVGIYNLLFGWVGLTINIHDSTLSVGSYSIISPSSIYPTDLSFMGLSVFTVLSIFMGLIYIIGIFFLISSRGR
jgi:hypothetical protein